ncbi:MAG TPA: DUF1223 domain-containing protein [Alphaproteobacteria bacterium]|nr:DUF1223 domain-containing protein [Alphaproteobacteria bacterium]
MFLRGLLVAVSLAGAASVAAGGELKLHPRAVLELFTSQGCSSCPAADALLRDLARDPDIVALAYHVDYWDYIGWPDTFGSKEHSDRQRDYAAAWGSSRIFTPQLIVNGREGVVASRKSEVGGAVAKAALELPVTLTRGEEMLEISIPPDAALPAGVVWLVSFLDHADVTIDRGENQGKTIAYSQIVTGRQVLGMWEPGTGAHLKLPLAEVLKPPANGAAILVQQEADGLPGRILGAASFTH